MDQPEANLRAVRARRELTLDEAAVGMGIQKATLSRLERGYGKPHAGTAKKIADFYGISIESVLGNAAAPPRDSKNRQPAVDSVQTDHAPAQQGSDMQSKDPASSKTPTAGPPSTSANSGSAQDAPGESRETPFSKAS